MSATTPPNAVCLAGRHVRLLPLTTGHVPDLARVGLDPELWRLSTIRVRSNADMERYVNSALAEQHAGTATPFVTWSIAADTIVGSTRFGAIDLTHRRVEIGWTWIAPPWQRTAVNTEAKLLMLGHAFDDLHCRRVELKTDALNTRSRTAIERLGATFEGTFRQHMLTDTGRSRDTVYYSITNGEWPAVRARLEVRLASSDERVGPPS